MSSTLFPFLALALAAVAFHPYLRTIQVEERSGVRPPGERYLALLILALAGIGVSWKYGTPSTLVVTSVALVLGLALSSVADLLASFRPSNIWTLALAVAGASALQLLAPKGLDSAQFALVFGTAVGALVLRSEPAAVLTIAALAIVGCDNLGSHFVNTDQAPRTGDVFALGAIAAGLVVVALARALKRDWVQPIALGVLVAGIGWIVATRWIYLGMVWHMAGLAVIAALVAHWVLVSGREDDNLRFLIATVAWVALGSLAFGLARGFGMSICLLTGVVIMLGLGNQRGLLSLGPLLVLVIYRVFSETHRDVSHALDIGQHYAMIGLMAGTLLPLLPFEWSLSRGRVAGARQAAALCLWAVLLAGVPALLVVILEAKGAVGFVVGLGFAAYLSGVRGQSSTRPLALACGVGTVTVLAYGWLSQVADLTRDDKVHVFTLSAIALLCVGLLIALLSIGTGKEKQA